MESMENLVREFKDAEMHENSYLPIIAAYCRKLGLVELVDSLVPSQMVVSPGTVVLAMVLDVLSGRTPLYRLEHFLATQDLELLLGTDIDPHLFNDTNLARSMDTIFDAGAAKIVTELGVRAAKEFSLDMGTLSYDTTSINVWGEYSQCEGEHPPQGSVVTYGYSKDKRKDLKQIMAELLCVKGGIPIDGRVLDGNSSDKRSNNEMLSRIGALLTKHGIGPGACVYVADSAMVIEDNLQALGGLDFVSRLPATYGVCNLAIEEAVDAQAWDFLGTLSEHEGSKKRPSAIYKAYETTLELHGTGYRAVVLHSSAYDKLRKKKLERAILKSEKQLKKATKSIQCRYFCRDDAMVAAAKVELLATKLHTIETTITTVEVRRRGRPPKVGPAPVDIRYELSWKIIENSEGIERMRELAGCFILVTSVPISGPDGLDARDLLRTYKGQWAIEHNFSFLKDDLIVNEIFLKTPSRIDVLGMVLIISLMIWRLMEHQMRSYIEQENETLTGWDNKQTDRPTSFMMSKVFIDVLVATIHGTRVVLRGIGGRQREFLKALGVAPSVFTDPAFRCVQTVRRKGA